MQHDKFYRSGKFIYKLRWPIILLWMLFVIGCLPFIPYIISPFSTTGFIDEHSPSAKTDHYFDKELGYNSKNKILLIYKSNELLVTNPLFSKKIKNSLKGLQQLSVKHEIIMPGKKQKSKHKHTAYVIVVIKQDKPVNEKLLFEFKNLIKKPSQMSIEFGGEPFFVDNVNKQTQTDLYKADFIAAPVSLITLILVFGSLVAAVIPLFLGGACALIILTSLFFLGHAFTLSIFTLNIALLLGLCLSLDYSLFFISRFRDELDRGLKINEAIAVTQAHAGKAIFFSGLAVFVSLSALFLFPINILFSVAVGGLTAVFFAVLTAIILLPAVLSVLNKKINFLAVWNFKKNKKSRSNNWRWLAETVVCRPLLFFFPTLLLLLLLGYPVVSAHFGVSDYRIFPEKSESRYFYNTYTQEFDVKELTPIELIVASKSESIVSRDNISQLYDLVQKLKKNPRIAKIASIVNTDNKMSDSQYYTFYRTYKNDKDVKQLLATTTSKHATVINITSKYSSNSSQTLELIKQLRTLKLGNGLTIHLTGTPVNNSEVLHSIYRILPYAILWIIIFTYLILLILLRSLFLPFKAILMNMLSLSACYGALVFVFQEGYLSSLLNFEPQGMLDISLLVIIFCALFGFSMDYEVFLLSRIKESYEKNHDNSKSIVFGIEKSSRIITSAAIIVIVICGSFLVAEVLMVKAFGLGIAVAIFVDAFLIRTILVPSTMALLKNWNWYLPQWLDKILPKL